MNEEKVEQMDEFEDGAFTDPDDDDWGLDWPDAEPDPEEADNEEPDSEDESDEADQHDSEESAAEPESEPAADANDTDQWLELKHLDDEPRKVSKEEAKVLAQKGLDYDRIRQKYDELQSSISRYQEMEKFLKEMQGEDFDSIEDFMDDTRARIRMNAEGISYNEALDQVRVSRSPAPQTDSDNGINVDAFVAKYPNVKAEEIPSSVWADVKNTHDLVASYDKYAEAQKNDRIAQLEAEIETLKQNAKNSSRSTGSSKSSGSSGGKSLIDILWEEDD